MKESRLVVNGVPYAYSEAGQGPLVLLGHGMFGSKTLMWPQVEHLSQSFRCVAIDWPGHGDSGFKADGWNVHDLVEDVAALIQALGENNAFLAGVSQGGAVFSRVALAYPKLVRGLVIMCAGPGAPPPQGLAIAQELARVLSEETEATTRREAAGKYAATYFHGPGFADRHPDRANTEIDVMVGHPRAGLPFIVKVPESYESIADRLKDISSPVLVLWGDKDGRPTLGADIAAAIPGAQLIVIEGAGHHINVDAPNEVSSAIDRFVRGVIGSSRPFERGSKNSKP